MIKLTEADFKEFVEFIFNNAPYRDTELLKRAKEKGWIEKTALEKAEEMAELFINDPCNDSDTGEVIEMIGYYRQAIEEAKESNV